MKTLILGLGNPVLSDDGAGLCVARALKDSVTQLGIAIIETCLSGLNLLDLLVGYDKAIIIDAIQTKGGEVGQIHRLEPNALNATRHTTTLHDVNLATVLALGRRLGLALPKEITIFAIEVENVNTFSEECTSAVEQAIPKCLTMVIQELAASPSP